MSSSTVIIGAGIIGCSTAFYLSETKGVDASSIHLVEACPEFFASASGKAGGFLAADWFEPETLSLGELSFQLHKQLAERYDGRKRWGYSRSTGTSYTEPKHRSFKIKEGRYDWIEKGSSRADAASDHEFRDGDGPTWLARRRGDSVEMIGKAESVAQVDPLRLAEFLLQACRERGVQIHQPATVTTVTLDSQRRPTSVTIQHSDGTEVEVVCSRLLLTAGAWTGRVWSTQHEANGCHAVFGTMRSGWSPEMFSRIGGEIYVAGLNSTTLPLPDLPTDAVIDRTSITELLEIAQKLMGSGTAMDDLEVTREGLCFRPATPHGQPILSRTPDSYFTGDTVASSHGRGRGGICVAAGHGPWGIALGLGTGKVMSELLLDQKTSASIESLALD